MQSEVIIWLLGIIVLSLFLLVGLSFLGYALFLLRQHRVAPIYSAMFTGGVFITGGLVCMAITKNCLSSKLNWSDNVKKSERQSEAEVLIKNNPGMSLSLAVAAGFFI